MNAVIEQLKKNPDNSKAKSYYIGLERGRLWAEDYADYFDIRKWSEHTLEEVRDIALPHDEEFHYNLLSRETPLEWDDYLKGWLAGVKQVRDNF